MKKANLRTLLSGAEAAALVRAIMTATGKPSTVQDVHGVTLLNFSTGPCDEAQKQHAVTSEGHPVGWVSGGPEAEPVAALLGYLLAQETDKEELLDEILDLYRQFNLLYGLSEKLATALEPEAVARTVLHEASRLIHATWGAVVVLNTEQVARVLAGIGQDIPAESSAAPVHPCLDAMLERTEAEIINDVRQDPRYNRDWDSIRSLIRAPLTSKSEPVGEVLLASDVPVTYTAADLKLLNSLASLAAPSIEKALLHERKLQEVQEREASLERLVEEMRTALDEARQKQKVAEITGTDHFQRLLNKAVTLKEIMHGSSIE